MTRYLRPRALLLGAVLVLAQLFLGPSTARTVTIGSGVDCDRIWQTPEGNGTFYETNRTRIDPRPGHDWPVGSPRSVGMDAAVLEAGLHRLGRERSVFSALVVRHGRLVAEGYFHGSRRDHSNNVHSVSKSVLQALIGIAVRRGFIGSIDDPVHRYLPEYFADAPAEARRITLRHLLTMTAGWEWQEDETEYTVERRRDWVKAIVERDLEREPGTAFTYSSGNTHLLSAVLQRASGRSTCEFAQRYLFDPLGITAEHWGRDPQGVYSGGYNLYLTPRELAKFGLLYLNRGRWQGRQVVPRETVSQSMRPVVRVGDGYSYAHGWWLRRIGGRTVPFAWGYGGQYIYLLPAADVVVVVTENTREGHENVDVDLRVFLEDYVLRSVRGRR
ncbi:serine hydrolase domain-containing protein [Streptomyces sp. NPDC058464]|uniref:serine hydrolase domain-containing protein n=1 Tax=Streptomyces sp. NPDC058464 TaxID=3346511 RepID=UPI0036617742